MRHRKLSWDYFLFQSIRFRAFSLGKLSFRLLWHWYSTMCYKGNFSFPPNINPAVMIEEPVLAFAAVPHPLEVLEFTGPLSVWTFALESSMLRSICLYKTSDIGPTYSLGSPNCSTTSRWYSSILFVILCWRNVLTHEMVIYVCSHSSITHLHK